MTPTERMIDCMSHVAAGRARRIGRATAYERGPAAWTVRDAAEPTPPGWERFGVMEPGGAPEMGLMKSVAAARQLGLPAPTVRETFAPPAPPREPPEGRDERAPRRPEDDPPPRQPCMFF